MLLNKPGLPTTPSLEPPHSRKLLSGLPYICYLSSLSSSVTVYHYCCHLSLSITTVFFKVLAICLKTLSAYPSQNCLSYHHHDQQKDCHQSDSDLSSLQPSSLSLRPSFVPTTLLFILTTLSLPAILLSIPVTLLCPYSPSCLFLRSFGLSLQLSCLCNPPAYSCNLQFVPICHLVIYIL